MNTNDTMSNVIFLAKEYYTSIYKSFCDKTHMLLSWPGAGFYIGQSNMKV